MNVVLLSMWIIMMCFMIVNGIIMRAIRRAMLVSSK